MTDTEHDCAEFMPLVIISASDMITESHSSHEDKHLLVGINFMVLFLFLLIGCWLRKTSSSSSSSSSVLLLLLLLLLCCCCSSSSSSSSSSVKAMFEKGRSFEGLRKTVLLGDKARFEKAIAPLTGAISSAPRRTAL